MNDQLLDYLLERLDDASKREVETRLQTDTEARRQLEALRQALAPLAADQEIVPPPHLVPRTIARVAEHVCRELPQAPTPLRSESGSRPWWRRADVLVAASLLAIFVGIGLPVLVRMRYASSPARIAECKNNLLQFYLGLKTYEDQQKRLPSIENNVAGMIVPVLQEAGALPATFNVSCPGHGPFLGCSLTVDEINAMGPAEFARHAPNLLKSYAFTLGYRDDAGVWHPIRRAEDAPDNATLIFADSPPSNVAVGNSANHGSAGQNVLYLDGSVHFLTRRNLGGDDIYLNNAKTVAAGIGSRDIVLGPSAAKP